MSGVVAGRDAEGEDAYLEEVRTEPPDEIPDVMMRVIASFDAALARLKSDRSLVWGTPEQALAASFEASKKQRKSWRQRRKCSYPGCESTTIRNSHTLAERSTLRSISNEVNELVTPRHHAGVTDIRRVGIGQASTFPGYCREHEDLFDFEKTGTLTEARHYALQSMRSAAREIFAIDFFSSQFEQLKTLHEGMVKNFLTGPDVISADVRVTGFHVVDPVISSFEDDLASRRSALPDLQATHAECAEAARLERYEDLALTAISVELPSVVALSGWLALSFSTGETTQDLALTITVVPNGSETLILMAAPQAKAHLLDQYYNRFFLPGGGIMTVESWMTYATDHWFASPRWWDNLDSSTRDRFIREFSDRSIDATTPLPFALLPDSPAR